MASSIESLGGFCNGDTVQVVGSRRDLRFISAPVESRNLIGRVIRLDEDRQFILVAFKEMIDGFHSWWFSPSHLKHVRVWKQFARKKV